MNTPQTERFHVATYTGVCCFNAEAVVGREAAEALRDRRIAEQKADNARLRQDYERDLERMVREETDRIPHLHQFNYRYVVEPCTRGDACIACFEAGLISSEGWA